MRYVAEYFFCSEKLITTLSEVQEIFSCIRSVSWRPEFEITVDEKMYLHQSGYNKAFDGEFHDRGWELRPVLHTNPGLIGDFFKNDVFVEVQFGNSSTIYRDYYKFHYGLTHRLLSLAVLIVPEKPETFFPTRPASVQNMAAFETARKLFDLLPIPVPILLIGLLPGKTEPDDDTG